MILLSSYNKSEMFINPFNLCKNMKSLHKLLYREYIEFIPIHFLDQNTWVSRQHILSKLDRINEKEISDPKVAQEVFLLKHRKELSKKAEEKLVPKVLKDIDHILEKKWCLEISKYDLNHVHLCKDFSNSIFDVNTLLSDQGTRLLYHGSENRHFMPYFAYRNIKSSLLSQPEVISIDYEEFVSNNGWKSYRFPKTTIHSSDLGWSEYRKIVFEKSPKGPYKLKHGTGLNMLGLLYDNLIRNKKLI